MSSRLPHLSSSLSRSESSSQPSHESSGEDRSDSGGSDQPDTSHGSGRASSDSDSSENSSEEESSSDESSSEEEQESVPAGRKVPNPEKPCAAAAASPQEMQQILMGDDRRLDERFTPEQLDRLNGSKDAYRTATARQRKELAHSLGVEFLAKMATKTGEVYGTQQRKAVMDHVRNWLSQRARTRREPIRWTVPWTARQVFYKENVAKVAATQQFLFDVATGRGGSRETTGKRVADDEARVDQSPDGLDDEDNIDLDVVEDGDFDQEPGKAPTLFHYFQKALTTEFNQLTEDEQQDYEDKALKWRSEGPTIDERRRLAEKLTGRVLRQFAQDVYKQMGVRLFTLVSFEDSSGDLINVPFDFNDELGGGLSFKAANRKWLEDIGLLDRWGAFVRDGMSGTGTSKSKRQCEVELDLRPDGYPVLPNLRPAKLPQGMQRKAFYVQVARRFLRIHYAKAQNLPPTDYDAGVPWQYLGSNLRNLIEDEYFPDHLGQLIDPNQMRVDRLQEILDFWYARQQQGLVPFRFHSYLKDGKTPVPNLTPPSIDTSATTGTAQEGVVYAKAPKRTKEDAKGKGSGKAHPKKGKKSKRKKADIDEPEEPTHPTKITAKSKKGKGVEKVAEPVGESENGDVAEVLPVRRTSKRAREDKGGGNSGSQPSGRGNAFAAAPSALEPTVAGLEHGRKKRPDKKKARGNGEDGGNAQKQPGDQMSSNKSKGKEAPSKRVRGKVAQEEAGPEVEVTTPHGEGKRKAEKSKRKEKKGKEVKLEAGGMDAEDDMVPTRPRPRPRPVPVKEKPVDQEADDLYPPSDGDMATLPPPTPTPAPPSPLDAAGSPRDLKAPEGLNKNKDAEGTQEDHLPKRKRGRPKKIQPAASDGPTQLEGVLGEGSSTGGTHKKRTQKSRDPEALKAAEEYRKQRPERKKSTRA